MYDFVKILSAYFIYLCITDNKPEFGPSFLSFYEGTQRNLYCGKCLVSITTENVDEKVKSLMNLKQDILLPLNETDFWDYEIFRINMILLSADAITMQPNSIKIYLTCEGIFSNEIDLDVREYDDKMKIKFVHFSSSMRPLMSFNIRLPDTRLKNQMRNLMKMVIDEMVSEETFFIRRESKVSSFSGKFLNSNFPAHLSRRATSRTINNSKRNIMITSLIRINA